MNNSTLDHSTCSQTVSTALTTVISLVVISALIGNILVAAAFLMNGTLRTSTNYFIVNMAVSDLLSASTNWPLFATEGMLSRKHLIDDPVATVVCKFGLYSRAVSQVASILSLVWIVVERFIAIVHPFKAKMLTRRLRTVLLILTWIIPLLIGAPYILFSDIVKEGQQTYCRLLWGKNELSIYLLSGFVLFYFVPQVTIIVLYSRIMKSLTVSRPAADEVQESTRMRNRQQNMIVMKVFISIVIVFFLCWTPLCVFLLLKMVFPSLYAKDSCLLFAGLFFYVFPSLRTAINPAILFVSSTNFHKALKEMFYCLTWKSCCKRGRVSPQTEVIELNRHQNTR
ncbi:QRFP-like peptide receptor [Oculina patagonica]